MNANKLKDLLNEIDITNLLMSLGANHPMKLNDALVFNTICHGGNSKKLYYYINSKSFFCYSNCGNIGDIFNLVSEVLNIDFANSYKYICNFFNISNNFEGGEVIDKVDNNFIKKFNRESKEYNLKKYDNKVLNNFEKLYHISWLEDNISKKAMDKFNIRYDILHNRVIIPHYDIDNNLIGIRCRNLNEEEVIKGKKYMPISIGKQMYNYPTHANLFGLNVSKKAIKKYKKVYIFESEKAVLQSYTYYTEDSLAIACSGSTISEYQIKLLLSLGVETCVLCLDKDFKDIGSKEDIINRNKISKAFIYKLNPYFSVELVWDFNNRLSIHDAPTDKGRGVFEQLLKERLYI